MIRQQHYDVIIIGSGLAGLYAATKMPTSLSIAVVTRGKLGQSNSRFAQGGVAATVGHFDSPKSHIEDTLRAGRGLNSVEAVTELVHKGKKCVEDLIQQGVQFDSSNGQVALGLEGGHSHKRILHAGGSQTGATLIQFCIQQLQKRTIDKWEEYDLMDILISPDRAVEGVEVFSEERQEQVRLYAPMVVIATGGYASLYTRTTNPPAATGEALAVASLRGLPLQDMEFVQFHPTAFWSEKSANTILITEAIRGEGAILKNQHGEQFMKGIPQQELAPRDAVAAAIYRQIHHLGNSVFLHLMHMNKELVQERFGEILAWIKDQGIDALSSPIPVAPAAHYSIGGIRSALSGETDLKGLYVIGEASCSGTMGANRLASNSLLECLVGGDLVAKKSSELIRQKRQPSRSISHKNKINFHPDRAAMLKDFRKSVGELLEKHAGIERTAEQLEQALQELSQWGEKLPHEREYYSLRCRYILSVAQSICHSALQRKETRGCHIRTDYPKIA